MHVRIEAVNQTYPMDGGEVENFLKVSLPNGQSIRVKIENDDLEVLLGVAAGPPKQREALPPTQHFTPVRQEGGEVALEFGSELGSVEVAPQAPVHATVPMVDWTLLSDSDLPPVIRQILMDMGVPAVMSTVDLSSILNEISDRMLQEASSRAVASTPPQRPLQQAQQPRPPIGRLQVATQPSPRRTVPMDDHGYPIVHQSHDPGERAVSIPDADEDGISQM